MQDTGCILTIINLLLLLPIILLYKVLGTPLSEHHQKVWDIPMFSTKQRIRS